MSVVPKWFIFVGVAVNQSYAVCKKGHWKTQDNLTMFFFMFVLFRMNERDTVTEKDVDIAIQMTLEYVLAHRDPSKVLDGQKK